MEVVFSDMDIFLTFTLFMFFFWMGYSSEKPSGGAFMLFSGFILFYVEALCMRYISSSYVLVLMSPIAIFIILMGIHKWFFKYNVERGKMDDLKRRD